MEEFDCPLCGNLDDFQCNMLLNGIYVPKGDYLPSYNSVEDIEADQNEPAPKRRRIIKKWILERTFASKKEAEAAVKMEKCWSKYYSNTSSAGDRVNYRCNAMKFRGKQCASGLYLLFDSRNGDVHLYRSEETHSHDDDQCMENAVDKIPAETEAEIRRLFELNTKPKAILYNLVIKGFEAPTKTRLTTFLTKLRQAKYGSEKLDYSILQKWLIDCSDVPQSETEPFIANFDIHIDDSNYANNEFIFFVSSKMLLKTAVGVEILHADATYKLIWQGLFVIFISVSSFGQFI